MVTFTSQLLDNCPALTDIIRELDPIPGGIYRARNRIQTNSMVNNGNVTLQAEQSVLLAPDIYVMPGAVFEAAIETCVNEED